jgi:hypothetical protein
MEKNQHNSSTEATESQNNSSFTGNQPGQQPPAPDQIPGSADVPAGKETHSESSFPQQEGETLGTP